MLEQAAQAAVEAGRGVPWLDIGVIGLLIKAGVDIGREFIKARGERSRFRAVQAKADIEEAKALQVSYFKDKDGNAKPTLVAFCPAHVELERKIAVYENEFKHVNESLKDIKASVDVIRAAVGKGN
jgi:hypothetical protein